MNEPICPACEEPIAPGERRVPFFTKDERELLTERSAVHLACLIGGAR
jgi:hypothetical protein